MVQCSVVQCSAVQCSAVQCGAVRAVRCSVVTVLQVEENFPLLPARQKHIPWVWSSGQESSPVPCHISPRLAPLPALGAGAGGPVIALA